MCNEVARRIALGQLREDWSELKVPLVFPEGLPNLGEQDSIRNTDAAVGEAFTLLTGEPGPDVAPYHHQQIVLPPRAAWTGWLNGSLAAADVLAPTAGGSLIVSPA